jgi:hypothetical protein
VHRVNHSGIDDDKTSVRPEELERSITNIEWSFGKLTTLQLGCELFLDRASTEDEWGSVRHLELNGNRVARLPIIVMDEVVQSARGIVVREETSVTIRQ